MLVLQEGPERNVLEAAVWDGFASCTGTYLDKLLKDQRFVQQMPNEDRSKGVLAKVEMLVSHF